MSAASRTYAAAGILIPFGLMMNFLAAPLSKSWYPRGASSSESYSAIVWHTERMPPLVQGSGRAKSCAVRRTGRAADGERCAFGGRGRPGSAGLLL